MSARPSSLFARRTPLFTLAVLAAGLGLGLAARADDDRTGTYDMTGRQSIWPWSPHVSSTLWLARQADGTYRVTRTFSWRQQKKDGLRGQTLYGTGRLSGATLDVEFPRTAGLSGALLGAQPALPPYRAHYTLKGDEVSGWCEAPGHDGSTKRFRESGRKGADRPWPAQPGATTPATDPTTPATDPTTAATTTATDPTPPVSTPTTLPPLAGDVRVDRPITGRVVLAGATVPLEVVPASAELTIEGPARRGQGGLEVTGPGTIRLTARQGGKTSPVVSIEAVTAEVVEVTVQDAIELQDARPPHFQRAVGAPAAQATWEPAAILQGTPLRLSLKLAARRAPTEPSRVRITAEQGGVRFDATLDVRDGQAVSLASAAPLARGVAVNALELPWKVGGLDAGTTRLRVYTTHGRPVENPMPQYAPAARPVTLMTKAHVELACTWAQGATRNVGGSGGSDSIPYQIDNAFRHHVAWKDYGSHVPAVPPYPRNAAVPFNYDDLPGYVSGGERGVSSIYYPPLEPTKDYQEYYHFSRNFGWWVLDNPEYTGGRCNQQASLICDIMGTVGITAQVYYIERVGVGKQTGRPMRRYYKSSRSTQSWNFHGVVQVTLDDGVKWIFDGSGSSPPHRMNGQTEELMAVPNGPFVDFWQPWSYEDVGGAVPRSDWPDTWRGVPLQAGEKYP